MPYDRILAAFSRERWAILPEKLEEIAAFLALKARGETVDLEAAGFMGRERGPRPSQQIGNVAVLPVLGTITHRANMVSNASGGTSTDVLRSQLRAAVNDPSVGAIVLDIDSPGGAVRGTSELAAEIRSARERKRVTAFVNSTAASAAYWLAASASEIVVTPTGLVGSIGVYATHEDLSQLAARKGVRVSMISAGKYKTEGNPYEPLSEEGRAAMQELVDDAYRMFVDDVAAGRGVSADVVAQGFGEGRLVTASKAIGLGMADRVGTFDDVLDGLRGKQGQTMSAQSNGDVAQDGWDEETTAAFESLNRTIRGTSGGSE